MSQKTLNLCLERYNFVKFGETTKSSHTVLCINNAYSVNSDKYRLTPTVIADKHGEGYVFTLNYDFDRPLFTIVQKSYSLDGTSGNIVFEGIDPISKGGSKYLRKVMVSPVKLSDGSYLLEVTNDEYLRIGTTGAALGDEELESLNEKIVTDGGIEKSVETVGGKQVLRLDAGGPSGAKEIVYFDVDPSDPPSGLYNDIGTALSNDKEPVIKIDGDVYFYTSTGTDKYIFVGGYDTEVVNYTTVTVSDDDSVVKETVDTIEGMVFPLYYHSTGEAFTVADKTGHALTKTEIVNAYRAGQIFMFSSYPASNTQAHWGYCCDINIDSDNTGYAEFFILAAFGGNSYEWEKYRINLSSGTEFVTLWGPNTSYSTGYSGSYASAADVTALQSQVSSLSDVSAYTVKGEATVAQLNAGPSGIQAGWAYQLIDSGTLTDGTLAVVAGDTVAWDGTKWFPLVKSDYYATKTYAQNVAHSIAPEFDPTRTSDNPYKTGESVLYNGKAYTFKVGHYGAWKAADVYPFSIFDYVNEIGRSVIFLTIVGYADILSRLNDGEFGYNTSNNQVVEKKGDTYAARNATKSDLFFYQNHFYVYDGASLVLQNDIVSKVPFSEYNNGYIDLNVGVGSIVNLTSVSSGGWAYKIIDAKEGDVFFVSGKGGGDSRLWGFIDSENKLLSVADASITRTDERIVAPQNAVKLISNSGKNTPHVVKQQMFFQDFTSMVTKRVEDVEVGLASDSAKINDLSDATILCNVGVENGGIAYATGNNTESSVRCRSISYLYGTMKVSLKSGFQIYTVIFYNKDTKRYSRSAYVQAQSATITPAANEVFRLSFAKSDTSANIDSSELKNSLFIEETWAKVVNVDKRVKAIETKRQPLVLFNYDHDLKDVSSIVSQFTMSPVSGLYAQVISFFDGLVSSFGDYVSKVDAALQEGISYPVEWGDNKLWMYKFASDNSDIYSDNNKKKKLLIVGGLHGNEMASPVNLCIFASNLCNIVDSNYYKLRASCDIYIIPVLNVTGSLANTRTNYNGVDLNRNFPASRWILDGEGTETYSGPSAGSEFETQVIVSLTETIKPDMAIDHHNYSGGKNAIYTEIYRDTQIQLAMQCGVDDAIAFSKDLPAYFGTVYNSALFGSSNSAPKITTGNNLPHMAEWWFEQDVPFSAIVEICNTIGWQEGIPGYSLDWMGNDTFSVGEYCFRNQILHYAQWVLDNV